MFDQNLDTGSARLTRLPCDMELRSVPRHAVPLFALIVLNFLLEKAHTLFFRPLWIPDMALGQPLASDLSLLTRVHGPLTQLT